MGKITFTVEGTTVGTVADGGGVQAVYEVSEQDSARIISSMAEFHAGDLEKVARSRDTGSQEDGDFVAGTWGMEDVLKEWFNGCIKTALRQTDDFEKRQAVKSIINVSGL